ncbi:NAD(+)/NADH kinase [Anaerosphaera multitolerans]|uniref:NAD kinase n=1 Tax=Anaerosphaera multitolerans TaxID=2487351 RepID=A0A437S4S4_9FIRM|nr:NAD(+)/NADH kinase [Anaerosphaera multitolerans]RVU54035.1 NAD(+)/NADH kinase [Anaerosphaera multitolerans]
MGKRIINILSNSNFESRKTTSKLLNLLSSKGFSPTTTYDENAELTICVGGDGSFLKAVHKNRFPQMPFVGINTGHLGFYQEISPDNIEKFIDDYIDGNYSVEELKLVGAEVFTKNRSYILTALNEIVLKAQHSKIIHINVYVNKNSVEKFSGDGILVSTPSGSTAYNFSTGGSIVHPSLEVLQMTPISPVNSAAYRSLSSSIIIPGNHIISLVPEKRYANSNLLLVDGSEYFFSNLKKVNLKLSNKSIKQLLFSQDSYWENLKDKFL